MRKYLLSTVFCFYCVMAISQIVKINNGLSTSSMTKVLTGKVVAYSGGIGLDYFERKFYYLSSELAYIKLGGKNSEAMYGAVPMVAKESWNCLQANTTFRLRYPIRKFHAYVGVGPKLDFILGSNHFTSLLYKDIERLRMVRITFGGKLEGGLAYDLGKLRLGVNVSYLFPIGKTAKDNNSGFWGETYLYNRSLVYLFSFGVRI